MPYKNNDYKNFIRSARWQRIRAYHLLRTPYAYAVRRREKQRLPPRCTTSSDVTMTRSCR